MLRMWMDSTLGSKFRIVMNHNFGELIKTHIDFHSVAK